MIQLPIKFVNLKPVDSDRFTMSEQTIFRSPYIKRNYVGTTMLEVPVSGSALHLIVSYCMHLDEDRNLEDFNKVIKKLNSESLNSLKEAAKLFELDGLVTLCN